MEGEDGELSQNPVTCCGSGNGDIISKHDSSLVWLCGFFWTRAASGFSKSSSGNLKEVISIDSKSTRASSRRWIHSLCVIDPGEEEKRASPPTEAVYRKQKEKQNHPASITSPKVLNRNNMNKNLLSRLMVPTFTRGAEKLLSFLSFGGPRPTTKTSPLPV